MKINLQNSESLKWLSKTPTQARAKQTVQKISDAASYLLANCELSSFNTNSVATRANVNIATLYTYFTDKTAIIGFLAEQYEEARLQLLANLIQKRPSPEQWLDTKDSTIDSLAEFRVKEPACVAVRHALLSNPQTRDFDKRSTYRAAEILIPSIGQLAPSLTFAELKEITHFYAKTVTSGIDAAFEDGQADWREIKLLKEMTTAWLATFIN